MIDTLLRLGRAARDAAAPPARLGLEPGYALVTLHRPANVDDPSVLPRPPRRRSSDRPTMPVVFPLHPRTQARLDASAVDTGRPDA